MISFGFEIRRSRDRRETSDLRQERKEDTGMGPQVSTMVPGQPFPFLALAFYLELTGANRCGGSLGGALQVFTFLDCNATELGPQGVLTAPTAYSYSLPGQVSGKETAACLRLPFVFHGTKSEDPVQ